MSEVSMAEVSILVVDDNNDLAEGMSDLLDALGYDVAIANDGFAAVSLVEKSSFDIALMDIKMPGMNGVEAYKQIKEINPKIEAIMMTGYSDDDLIKEALSEGAREVMNKPIDFGRLVALIEAITNKSSNNVINL